MKCWTNDRFQFQLHGKVPKPPMTNIPTGNIWRAAHFKITSILAEIGGWENGVAEKSFGIEILYLILEHLMFSDVKIPRRANPFNEMDLIRVFISRIWFAESSIRSQYDPPDWVLCITIVTLKIEVFSFIWLSFRSSILQFAFSVHILLCDLTVSTFKLIMKNVFQSNRKL